MLLGQAERAVKPSRLDAAKPGYMSAASLLFLLGKTAACQMSQFDTAYGVGIASSRIASGCTSQHKHM